MIKDICVIILNQKIKGLNHHFSHVESKENKIVGFIGLKITPIFVVLLNYIFKKVPKNVALSLKNKKHSYP